MTNIAVAREIIERVRGLGVVDFCICGGSRNAPLIAALGSGYSFVDERSAAFFALGRAKRDGKPVAVITTSGTAAAELLPATVEAFYSGVPLILITADRPARLRGTAAPQSIEQVGLFGVYAATDIDRWNRAISVEINVHSIEPLLDE